MSVLYRARQFFRAVGAWFRPSNSAVALASGHLSPAALDIFQAMPRYDRQHGIRVVRLLQENGHDDPDLLAAALLHDAGKTVGQDKAMRLWHRVAVVLMRAFWPSLLERIAEDRPGSWQQPFHIHRHHAKLSAELARQAGCSSRTVELILRHEEPGVEEDPLLEALQYADGVN